jgi:hypothetical protein
MLFLAVAFEGFSVRNYLLLGSNLLFGFSFLVQVCATIFVPALLRRQSSTHNCLSLLELLSIFLFGFSRRDVSDKSGIGRLRPRGPGIEREFNGEFFTTFPQSMECDRFSHDSDFTGRLQSFHASGMSLAIPNGYDQR